jgi:hypothetical protein
MTAVTIELTMYCDGDGTKKVRVYICRHDHWRSRIYRYGYEDGNISMASLRRVVALQAKLLEVQP